MLKKTFIRLMLLGTMAVATFFIIVAVQKPYRAELTEAGADSHSHTEFIFEGMVGSMLIEVH
jgi:hypothetical protein